MKTLLFCLQVITGLASLGLLGLAIVTAYHGETSRKLARWILGLAGAFVVLTLVITGM